jgi:phosphoenolpyruvate carboxykinase (ATP)
MVTAAVNGLLLKAEFEIEPSFGFSIPKAVPGVPSELLKPRNAWSDKADYDKTAAQLAELFAKNFEKFEVSDKIRQAGPKKK